MVSRSRLGLGVLLAYVLVEIAVDDALVFLNLTGRRVPSFTLLLLGALGVEFGVGGSEADAFARLAVISGALGLLLVLGAVWRLVAE